MKIWKKFIEVKIFCILITLVLLNPVFSLKNENNASNGSDIGHIYAVMKYVPEINPAEESEKPPVGNPPDEFSWRNYSGEDWTTPARYQGACGSCWDFAAVGALESVINIREGIADLNPDLSEQYIMSCLPLAGGCSGGSPYLAYKYIKSTSSDGNYHNGIVTESCFPYKADDTIPCSSKCSNWEENLIPISDYGYWTPDGSSKDRDRIKSEIMENGPVVSFMMATEDFMQWGLYHHNATDYYHYPGYVQGINHCIVIVGWKDDSSIRNGGYWICKNSWGRYWGNNGFFNIEYGSLHVDDYQIVWVNYDKNSVDWPPVANAGGPYYGKVGETIRFDGSKSCDDNGNIINWSWNFGDGATSNLQNPEHTYNKRGIYTVKLVVTDKSGNKGYDEASVFVDVWENKNKWTFDISNIELNTDYPSPAHFKGSINGLDFEVVGVDSHYKLNFKGKLDGEFYVSMLPMNISGKLMFSRLDGSIYINHDFGIDKVEATLRGIAPIRIPQFFIPIPIPFKISFNVDFSTPYTIINFPISVGKIWDIPSSNIKISSNARILFGIINIPFDYNLYLGSIETTCTSEENINVEAGNYDAYKISILDLAELYYSPEVANIIKFSISYEDNNIYGELKSTNYV